MVQKQHLRSLDSLRGLAALGVCLFHAEKLFGIGVIVPHAYLAVDFFFILSGFILTLRYKEEIINRLSFNEFFIIRIARLYPLYLALTLVGMTWTFLQLIINQNLGVVLKDYIISGIFNIFALPSFSSHSIHEMDPIFPFLNPAWSIFWEIIVSVLFYLWVKNQKKLNKYFIWSLSLMLVILFSYSSGMIDGGWQKINFWNGGLRALTGFFAGIICASIAPKLSANKFIPLSIIGFIISVIYIAFINQNIFYIEAILISIIFPIIVIGFSKNNSAILSNKLGDFLGGISYSVYLIHLILINIANTIITRLHLSPSPLIGIIWLCGLLGLSYLSWQYFEIPMRKYTREKLSKI